MEDKKVCVVCPVCGAVDEVETVDIYALDALDDTHIIEYYSGICMDCDAELQWEEVYELIRVENVRSV